MTLLDDISTDPSEYSDYYNNNNNNHNNHNNKQNRKKKKKDSLYEEEKTTHLSSNDIIDINRNNNNENDINLYEYNYFTFITKVDQILYPKNYTKRLNFSQINKIIFELFDKILFDKKFILVREYDYYQDVWWELRASFMNDVYELFETKKLSNLLSVIKYCWDKIHNAYKVEWRWPIKKEYKKKIKINMNKLKQIHIISLLKETYPNHKEGDLHRIFYAKYLKKHFELIQTGMI